MFQRFGFCGFSGKAIGLTMLFFSLTFFSTAQKFSEEPAVFKNQAVAYLQRMGTEAGNKVAFDFNNAWNGQFNSTHKEKIIQIAFAMKRKGYPFKTYYWHFFSYLAYSMAQERIDALELDNVLDINLQVVESLNREEYADFLLGMNTFFARRYLHFSRALTVQVPGGTYDFKLVDFEAPPSILDMIPDETAEEGPLAVEETEVAAVEEVPPVEDEPAEDTWDDNDDWGNDDWGNDDWGSNDSWGNDDSWVSDDSWDNNSSWDDNSGSTAGDTWSDEPVQSVPQRKELVRNEIVPQETDYISLEKNNYIHPAVKGPTIDLRDIQLLILTPYDSLSIRKVKGNNLLQNNTFVGESGILEWPRQNVRMRGAEVTLGEFNVKTDRPVFKTPNAKISYPGFLDKEVEGVFTYRSVKRPSRALSNYPVFTSYEPDATLRFPGGKVVYTGGVEFRGNKLFGASISRKPGTLEVSNSNGNKIVFRGLKFAFREDSTITSAQASMTIFIGQDSIYHPSVEMEYHMSDEQLTVLRDKKHSTTSFTSSYHGMIINTDLIKWNTTSDSVDFSILNGKDLVPATFESMDFFSTIRFRRLTGPFGFHPIAISVAYAKQFDITEFVIDEIAELTKIDVRLLKGAMKMLEQYNFADYNEETGLVKLNERAFHYYEASAKRKDYDNLFVPSRIGRGSNASMRLDSMEIVARGVKKFYVTTDFEITIEPEGGVVRIGENRNIKFDGAIDAIDFKYKGTDFEFDYENFMINMPNIDSIRIQLPPEDSTAASHNPANRESLNNHLTKTSGQLFLNKPTNRAGHDKTDAYPYFVTDTEAIVYFDGKEVLDGAYDKSVRFIIPPLEVDSIDRDDASTIEFPGTFNSGDIFPPFGDTLHIQKDRSLGFVHDIPEEGYNLYKTGAKTYEKITLNSQGIRGGGKIDFLTSTIFSRDFIYYPDSVTANGQNGEIRPGTLGEASYPDVQLGAFRMYWLPRKDSMYLRTVNEPFKFYDATAELTGEANITTKGVYGSGLISTRGSTAESDEFAFEELSYSARHAIFKVLTDDPEKPAMEGDDIALYFDLVKNQADITPEITGVAAISFPYAALNTSITNATWFLEDSIITMEKPENILLEESYFYSTREDLDSLSFNATKATYDINSQEMDVEGIPYIAVADAEIIPKGNEMTVLANSVLQTFEDAEVIFENDSTYHYLFDATIDVESRNAFSGGATYLLPIGADTFDIQFRTFDTDTAFIRGDSVKYSVAEGLIPDTKNLEVAEGFLFKGGITLKAYKQALELEGAVKPIIPSIAQNEWVTYSRTEDETDVIVDFGNAVFDDGSKAVAGMHYDNSGNIYPTFVEQRQQPDHVDFFMAKGQLKYNSNGTFSIEKESKTLGESYEGHTLIYDDSTQAVFFEGTVTFLDVETNEVKVDAAVLGNGNRTEGDYNIDAFITMDYQLNATVLQLMAQDLLDIVERLGNPPANDIEVETLVNLSNIVGEAPTRAYETGSLRDYVPLLETSPELIKSLVISGVKMQWNKEHRAWHNTTKLGISNVLEQDINAKMDGFLEFKKGEAGGDIMNLFLQAAPGTWYFFGYEDNHLAAYSSNSEFNTAIAENSNEDRARPGELILLGADETETLTFINNFREKYFGITEPYNLISPTDVNLEEENFDTIEEEDDDGFGF